MEWPLTKTSHTSTRQNTIIQLKCSIKIRSGGQNTAVRIEIKLQNSHSYCTACNTIVIDATDMRWHTCAEVTMILNPLISNLTIFFTYINVNHNSPCFPVVVWFGSQLSSSLGLTDETTQPCMVSITALFERCVSSDQCLL